MNNSNLAGAAASGSDIHIKVNNLADLIAQRRIYYIFKRIFDILASLIALVVLFPLMLLIALVIFIDDPHGSPFFVQERVGKNGSVFKFYKFRSMVVNAEKLRDSLDELNEKDGPVFKIKNDPRVTRIGRLIRRTSLDELPQLLNILKGDMSIVGPRPALPDEVSQYSEYSSQRLLVTPGLTCLWQASTNRDSIGFDEWVSLDIKYITEQCFRLDIKLILKTIRVIFTAQGN